MTRREFTAVFRDYLDALRRVIGCVATERLEVGSRGRLQLAAPIGLALRDLQPVPLRGQWALQLKVGQIVRIAETVPSTNRGGYRVETLKYVYRFSDARDHEIVAYHWAPDDTGETSVNFPHLHIGRVMIAEQSAIRPRDIHKAHIPTGFVSLPAVVRLALTEFGVTPLRTNWEEVLVRAETALMQAAPSVA